MAVSLLFMKQLLLPIIAASALCVYGCAERAPEPSKADPQAISDPDAKARQLLASFNQAEDQATWIQANSFALSVFETVKDPKLKAEYTTRIAPLMGKVKDLSK